MKKIIVFLVLTFLQLVGFSQTKDNENQLALLYYSQGEYEKAADSYKTLFDQTHSQIHFDYLIDCYAKLGETTKAEKITNEQIKRYPKSYYYQIKLATIYSSQGKQKDADDIYEKTIKKASKQLESCLEAGLACLDNKADSVAKIIYENGQEKFPENKIIVENLSKIYLHLGENDKLADCYINLLQNNTYELQFIENQLQFILYDNSNPKLKSTLTTKISAIADKEKKDFTFKELYLWLMLQDKNFAKAFELSKDIDIANDEDGEHVYEVGNIALSNNEYGYATDCFSYVVHKGPMADLYNSALKNLLETSYNKIFKTNQQPDITKIADLEKEYLQALDEISETKYLAEIIENLAHIQAFYLNKTNEAIELLKKAIDTPSYKSQKSNLEMELAQIYLRTNDIWGANMLFASVALNYKNNDIGHEAQLYQAKIAYFNGNFAYAQALLDVLKGSTSKLISNNAFELAQLISDNTALDTSTTALEIFARGDLLLLQGKPNEAIVTYDSIQKKFPGHSLEDEILMRKAEIAENAKDFDAMLKYLTEIEQRFSYEIFADKAIFKLAEYYDCHNDSQNAQEKYKKLLMEYPNSLYTASARKRYRELSD